LEQSTLKRDVIGPGVKKIAEYTPDTERQVRHKIARHGFPIFRHGSLIYSRRSWLDLYYSGQPVNTNGASK
jgi:hypothetical protein